MCYTSRFWEWICAYKAAISPEQKLELKSLDATSVAGKDSWAIGDWSETFPCRLSTEEKQSQTGNKRGFLQWVVSDM